MKSYGLILFIAVSLFVASGFFYDRGMMGVSCALGASGVIVLLLGPFVDQPRR